MPSTGDIVKLDELVLKSELPDLSGYALKSELPNLSGYALKSELPDLSGYALKSELPDLSGYALKSELPDLSGYALKSEGLVFEAKPIYPVKYSITTAPSKEGNRYDIQYKFDHRYNILC